MTKAKTKPKYVLRYGDLSRVAARLSVSRELVSKIANGDGWQGDKSDAVHAELMRLTRDNLKRAIILRTGDIKFIADKLKVGTKQVSKVAAGEGLEVVRYDEILAALLEVSAANRKGGTHA